MAPVYNIHLQLSKIRRFLFVCKRESTIWLWDFEGCLNTSLMSPLTRNLSLSHRLFPWEFLSIWASFYSFSSCAYTIFFGDFFKTIGYFACIHQCLKLLPFTPYVKRGHWWFWRINQKFVNPSPPLCRNAIPGSKFFCDCMSRNKKR